MGVKAQVPVLLGFGQDEYDEYNPNTWLGAQAMDALRPKPKTIRKVDGHKKEFRSLFDHFKRRCLCVLAHQVMGGHVTHNPV